MITVLRRESGEAPLPVPSDTLAGVELNHAVLLRADLRLRAAWPGALARV